MKLYIQIENGTPINHPALEENLMAVYNGIIPNNWEPFERIELPKVGVYQILNNTEVTYQKINGIWKDIWDIRDMTTEEKLAKQQLVIDNWNLNVDKANYASWVFNSETCEYIPPFSPPSDGKNYYWIEANGWVEVPEYPSDGSIYNLDKTTLTWVVATN
jgi:hypothetical protein